MNVAARLRDLPLQLQLVLLFGLLSVGTTAITTIALTSMSGGRVHKALTERAERIATRLQTQLQPAIALDDHDVARSLFDAYAADRELDGIAVYATDGELIEGRGHRPARFDASDPETVSDARHVRTTAWIESSNGRRGRLYLSFSTELNDAAQRREQWVAAAIGTAIASFALLLAVWTSGRMSRRLVSIADAADRMAAGELPAAPLDERSKDEVGAVAHAFNVMVRELQRLAAEDALRVMTEHARLESLVSSRTEELERSREMFKLMAESTRAIPFTLDLTRGCFTYLGAQPTGGIALGEAEPSEPGELEVLVPRSTNSDLRRHFDDCAPGLFEFLTPFEPPAGSRSEVRWTGTCEYVQGAKILRGLLLDVTEVRRLARELTAAQKLESIGRLAAGMAHEINTPVQFVSDNVQFVRTALTDLAAVIAAHRALHGSLPRDGESAAALRHISELEQSADIDYLMHNLPPALDSALEGLGRIATIVRSMKVFAHPDQLQKTEADLNQAIRSTLVVARNEYKYVARIDAEYGDLPPVPCHPGEINQVILNLLINAAHAIGDVVAGSGELGVITLRTRCDGDAVEISIGDSGTGIPESIRDKIFDPFFTTKSVGVGTGQGLSIARSIIVNKHGGSLRFESECGKGTTFYIRLPRSSQVEPGAAIEAAA
jgi:signal transduction histidine kinase/HAMP domain-containing protein